MNDVKNGYREDVTGYWQAQDIMKVAAVEVKARLTRVEYEQQTFVGGVHEMDRAQKKLYKQLYSKSHLVARTYATAMMAGYKHPPVANLPTLGEFQDPELNILINAASFPSLGESECSVNRTTTRTHINAHAIKLTRTCVCPFVWHC